MSQSRYPKNDERNRTFSKKETYHRSWSLSTTQASTTQEIDPDSWFNNNQTAKEFQQKMEDKQKVI